MMRTFLFLLSLPLILQWTCNKKAINTPEQVEPDIPSETSVISKGLSLTIDKGSFIKDTLRINYTISNDDTLSIVMLKPRIEYGRMTGLYRYFYTGRKGEVEQIYFYDQDHTVSLVKVGRIILSDSNSFIIKPKMQCSGSLAIIISKTNMREDEYDLFMRLNYQHVWFENPYSYPVFRGVLESNQIHIRNDQ